MLIRPVQPTDAAEWLRLRMALWPDSTPEKEGVEIEAFLAEPHIPQPDLYAAYVCERAPGSLCGLVEVSIHGEAPGCTTSHVGYLEAWYVDPDVRQKGVGAALVAAAEQWARGQGCSEMASDTDPSYPHSPAAHAALGYGEVVRYFRKQL
jgi:aminoglycoside 6'-N-acetyltransferase I